VDVFAGREIHHRIRAPARRPRQLLDFFVDRRRDGRIADVRVDLHEKRAPDDHGFELGVIDVRRNDGATARDLVAHFFRRAVLADRDELHLRGNLAAPRVVHLRDVRARLRPTRKPFAGEADGVQFRHRFARDAVDRARTAEFDRVVAARYPRRAQRREPRSDVGADVGVAVRTARIVDDVRFAVREQNLAHRHADRRIGTFGVDAARTRAPRLVRRRGSR